MALIAQRTQATPPIFVVDNPADPRGDATHLAIDGFAANDHVALRRLEANPWPADYRTRPGDNLTMGSARIAAGAAKSGYSVDYIRRGEAVLIATGDTAHAHYLSQTDQLFANSRSLAIAYQLKSFEADGVRAGIHGKAFDLGIGGKTQWGISASLLRGLRLRTEMARGLFTTDGTTASLNGGRELWYSHLKPTSSSSLSAFHPFTEEEVPAHGFGYAFDLGGQHEFENGAKLSLAINDLGGKITWRNMPHMTQEFAINNISATTYSSSGAPAVSGFHDYRDYKMSLDRKYFLALEIPLDRDWRGYANLVHTAGRLFPVIGLTWDHGSNFKTDIDYDTRWKTIGISANWSPLSIGIRSSRVEIDRSRTLGIQLAAHFPF